MCCIEDEAKAQGDDLPAQSQGQLAVQGLCHQRHATLHVFYPEGVSSLAREPDVQMDSRGALWAGPSGQPWALTGWEGLAVRGNRETLGALKSGSLSSLVGHRVSSSLPCVFAERFFSKLLLSKSQCNQRERAQGQDFNVILTSRVMLATSLNFP